MTATVGSFEAASTPESELTPLADYLGSVLRRVRALPAWLRIDARFGSVYRRRGDPALVLR